jgi:uncharacterized protein YdhG (YjbR/CyaY superfamily)
MAAKHPDVDAYFQLYPKPVQLKLGAIRRCIRKAAPKAVEGISYRIPAYALDGALVYFAAFKQHIGFYPTSSGITAFKAELKGYKASRGAVQFPLDQALPLKLVEKIVRYRVRENRAKAATKVKAKRSKA